jgi:hypothetical protein
MSDLQTLRAKADKLGVKYHHRAGPAKIQQAIDDFLSGTTDKTEPEPEYVQVVEANERKKEGVAIIPMTAEEYRKWEAGERRKMAGALVRVRVQCMNPMKKEWPGEILSVGSPKVGTFKKYIPFNNEPYHVPKIILDMMKERQCSVFYNAPGPHGQQIRKSRLINEFAIEELPPLTQEEIKQLATKQAMARGEADLRT